MKIGVFDSGLGGLIITNALAKALPQYDYVYLGDTARVPYGNRSPETIYHFTQEAVGYLFRHNCALVITACNTVSVEALIQYRKHDIPNYYPDRDAIGVIRPTAETIVKLGCQKVGILATSGTVTSKAYPSVLHTLDASIQVVQVPAPLLVPLIENDGTQWAQPILKHYLDPLIAADVDAVVLACTHYPFFKDSVQKIMGPKVAIISQDEIMPAKLADYLQSHPEIEYRLSKNGTVRYVVTDINDNFRHIANNITGTNILLHKVRIGSDI